MRPTRYLARAAGGILLLSALSGALGVPALLAERSSTLAGNTLLQELKPIADEELRKPVPEDWLMRRGDSHDLHGRWKAICRDSDSLQPES